MTPRIIALGHQSRVGKDTAAKAMEAELTPYGTVRRFAFAEPLKRIAHELLGQHGLREGVFYESAEGAALRDVPLCGGCPEKGACTGSVHLTPVQCWIHLGQKMRDLYPAVWAEATMRAVQEWGGNYAIITDLRFPNEAQAVRAAGGFCVRVVRPDAPPPKGSDHALPTGFLWDAVIENDGTVEQLRAQAAATAVGLVRP